MAPLALQGGGLLIFFPVDLYRQLCQLTRRSGRDSRLFMENFVSDNKALMAGKRGLIMGVANNRSIAWGIAKACAYNGAELAFTYQGRCFEEACRAAGRWDRIQTRGAL